MPTAVQPYSLDSFFSLALSDSDSVGAALPSLGAASARRGREEWNGRLGFKKGVLTRAANLDRATVDLGTAVSCDSKAL